MKILALIFPVLLLLSLVEESIKSELIDSSTTLLCLHFLSGDFGESFLSVEGSQMVNKAYLRNTCFSKSTTKEGFMTGRDFYLAVLSNFFFLQLEPARE